jgi:hypothetical protein
MSLTSYYYQQQTKSYYLQLADYSEYLAKEYDAEFQTVYSACRKNPYIFYDMSEDSIAIRKYLTKTYAYRNNYRNAHRYFARCAM